MADSPASHLADEATDPGAIHGAPRGTKEQEEMKGEPAIATSEPMREELVQSAVSFLKHPKVVASSDVQRRSFLENKGLTVDEIEEAFRRLLSPPSNSTSSDTCKSQGVSDRSCRVTQVMEMIQRGERPDDIQDINDEPPNPDQPISEPRMTPKPKPWEKQGQESSSLDLKAHPSDSSEPTSGAQTDRTNHSMESNNNSDHGDALLIAEPAMGSEAPADDDAAPLEQ